MNADVEIEENSDGKNVLVCRFYIPSQFLITICFYLKFLRFDNYIDTTVSKREESKESYISINSRESAIFYQA